MNPFVNLRVGITAKSCLKAMAWAERRTQTALVQHLILTRWAAHPANPDAAPAANVEADVGRVEDVDELLL